MDKVNTPSFVMIKTSFNQVVVWYFRKNMDYTISYCDFLHLVKSELIEKLSECVRIHSIKYNLKSEATYVVPNIANSAQNHLFKTTARELFAHSNVESSVDRAFTEFLAEVNAFDGEGRGFTLSYIDGLLLCVLSTHLGVDSNL